jgi:CRP-like cAMP-binding protein
MATARAPGGFTVLAGLGEEERRAVLRACRRRRFKRDEVVFHEGDPGDTLHLLDKGHVLVQVAPPLGGAVTVAVLGPGASFGELALVSGRSRRHATILTLEPTETLVLDREGFAALCRDHPDIHEVLTRLLADQVVDLTRRLVEALHVSAEARVLRRLAELARAYGGEGAEVPVTQATLASLAGTARPTTNRVLQQAADEGWVELGRGRVAVVRLDDLEREAARRS